MQAEMGPPGELPQLPLPRQLPRETELGRFLKPLVDRLKALPGERQVESAETFGPVWEHLKGRRMADFDLREEDVLFLLTDKVGSILRRPVIDRYVAGRIMDASPPANTPDERSLKELFLSWSSSSAWSRFFKHGEVRDDAGLKYADARPLTDCPKLGEDFYNKACEPGLRLYAYGFMENAVRVARSLEGRYVPPLLAEYTRSPTSFLTDPPHAFKQAHPYRAYLDLIGLSLEGKGEMPPLQREASFMLVEDNHAHAVIVDLFKCVKRLSMYTPAEGDLAQDPLTVKYEEKGCYESAERALDVIAKRHKAGRGLPDVILSDIELGEGMSGLMMVERLHNLYPNAIILMVYSSNARKYGGEIEGLRSRGIIAGAWNKAEDFSVKDVVEAVNLEFDRRGRGG